MNAHLTSNANPSPIHHERIRPAFQIPVVLATAIGIGLATAFYLFVWLCSYIGVFPLLIRYACCHIVAGVSVYMFSVAVTAMVLKFIAAKVQSYRVRPTQQCLRSLVSTAPQDSPIASADWLGKIWASQKESVYASWLGQRVGEILARQNARGTCRYLEEDLRDLAEHDADAQHQSYGLVRIVSWAMPMFGFLGTVIGISATLGQMDTKALASGSQEAMNSLTAGLYVAFDTTAVGLVLTMAAMFIMFIVSSTETRLLGTIDREVSDNLQGLLCEDDSQPKDIYRVEETVRLVAQQFVAAVEGLVDRQATLWQKTIEEAQERWTTNVSATTEVTRHLLTESLESVLDRHVDDFARAQAEGITQLDARYHQWQTTLSEQTRAMHSHHGELVQQTELLTELIEKGEHLNQIQEGLQQNLARLTDIDRFHEAAIVLAEGVAVLGTQLERSGYLKPRLLRKIPNAPVGEEPRRKAA